MSDEKDKKTEVELTNENILGEKSEQIQRVSLVSSSPSARSIVRVVVIVLLLLAVKDFLGVVLGSLTYLFFMIVLAIFFAYLINPLVDLIRKPFEASYQRLMPRSLAIGVSFLIVFSVLGIAAYYLAPGISRQARTFVENIPTYTTSVQSAINDMNRRLDRMRIADSVQTQINERINLFLSAAGTFLTTVLGLGAIYAITYLPWLILVPILAFFFLKDAQLFKVGLLRVIPVGDWRSRVESVMTDVNSTLKAYARAHGQPCTLTKYRVQANYQVPGWRTQIECTFKNKQTYKNVETLSGDYAWDEDMPGAELVAGQGKATPNQASLVERRIRLWASPHGAVKAAIAGAAGLPPAESFGENPAVLLDNQAKAGAKSTTTLEWQGDKAILTFPIPDVPGATAVATLTNYLPDSVVVTNGADKTEFIYGKWADWNNPLFKIDALYAGTILERKNGVVVRNVTAKVTEIGQIYVIMPVPASVQKAGK